MNKRLAKKKKRRQLRKRLVRQKIAAERLDLSEATLERDRWRSGEIPYIRVGPRSIKYDLNQLDVYLETKTVKKEIMNHG